MLKWCEPFSIFSFLDSNQSQDAYGRYECLLAVGAVQKLTPIEIDELSMFHKDHPDWLFGHINYDYKNHLHNSLHPPRDCSIGFDNIFFFVPKTVLYVDKARASLTIESYEGVDGIYSAIIDCKTDEDARLPPISFTSRTSKEKYIATVDTLRGHIKKGDCYEINYCNEFYVQDVNLIPSTAFSLLNDLSKAPFSAFYKVDDRYMMCASPERYLWKEGSKVISQPIKGTSSRYTDATHDAASKNELYNNIKERAENVMITDLVRNDLARSCKVGSVVVEELFGIYSFPQVHQMISTITGQMNEHQPFSDAIKYSFPMGSMTGAPKLKVMQLIDEYEDAARGLYSGSVGYITPAGDFDFNVIIRSLFYNMQQQMLTYQAGGAITYDSVPEKEWEEMRLKAWAMENIFSAKS